MSGLQQCICCSVCALLVIVLICVILSFSSLEVNTYGLDYSPITKVISPQVFTSGFHYLGFMHKFIVYPATLQTFQFSDQAQSQRGLVSARSSDGLMVSFRAQFQYQFNMNDLPALYNRYGEDYQTPCIRFAVDKMNDVAARYAANTFFKNLQSIQSDMQKELQDLFLKECFASVQSLQLAKAELPPAYNEALQDYNLAQQKVETVKKQQRNVQIDMQTQMQNAKVAAPVVVNQAKAAINALKDTNQAAIDAYYAVTKSEADSYKVMQESLGYTSDKDILDYIMVKTVTGFNQKNTILKMEDFTAPTTDL